MSVVGRVSRCFRSVQQKSTQVMCYHEPGMNLYHSEQEWRSRMDVQGLQHVVLRIEIVHLERKVLYTTRVYGFVRHVTYQLSRLHSTARCGH